MVVVVTIRVFPQIVLNVNSAEIMFVMFVRVLTGALRIVEEEAAAVVVPIIAALPKTAKQAPQ